MNCHRVRFDTGWGVAPNIAPRLALKGHWERKMNKPLSSTSEKARVYDSSSPEYQAAFRTFLSCTDQKEKAMAFLDNEIKLLPGKDTFIDVGAGTGKLTAHYAPSFRHTLAIEPNPSLVSELRTNCSGVTIFQNNLNEAVVSQKADFVLCSHVFYYLPRHMWLASLDKMAGWLAVGGVLEIALQNRDTDCMKMLSHFLNQRFDLAGLAAEFSDRAGRLFAVSLTTVPATIRTASLHEACCVAEFMLNLLPMPAPPLMKDLESYVQRCFLHSGSFEYSCDQDFLRVQRLNE